jgi:uncharacterized protein YjbI with pentapeptide repeats
VAKCAYRGERIREIEEKWIDENIEDEEERRRKKEFLNELLKGLEGKVDCRFEAIPGGEFCIFHDPDYWMEHSDEVRQKFLEHLERDEEKFFIGFHLPSIKLPKVVEKELHMELAKLHGILKAIETKFEGTAWFNGVKFEEAWFGEATFKAAWFNEATFKEASFNGAMFEGLAWFNEATFKKASFNGAMFEGSASFNKATFKAAWFDKATFEGSALFSFAKFLGVAGFDDAVFSKRVVFKDSILLPDLLENCSNPCNYISFRRVRFVRPEEVVFDGCYMRRVSFIHTDVSRIVFRNVNWDMDFRVFDEELFLIKTGRERKAFFREYEEKLKRILDVLNGKKKDEEIEREVELEPEICKVLTELNRLKEMSDEDKKKREELEEKLRELKEKLRGE